MWRRADFYATPIGLRDRALVGLMVYSFARVGAAFTMRVEDVYAQGRRMIGRWAAAAEDLDSGGLHAIRERIPLGRPCQGGSMGC